MNTPRVLILTGLLLGWSAAALADSGGGVLEVGRFSEARPGGPVPEGWVPLTFKKIPRLTRYELVEDGGVVVVKAVSEASASGLVKAVRVDPGEFPVIRWRWKIDHLLQRSDVSRKEGDDYPARVYITFEYEPERVAFSKKLKYQAGRAIFGDIPIAAINYIWDTRTPVGTVVENAFTSFTRMIVVESGPQNVGRWVEEERNLYEDYRRAFGEEPPRISGVAIMTDTDNTGESATAWYGDIVLDKGRGGPSNWSDKSRQ